MKRLLIVVSMMMVAGFATSSVVSAKNRIYVDDVQASSEFKRDISKEFSVGSSPTLSISNEFGSINIKEGADDKIVFKITITGKGKDHDAAKKYAESVDIDFKQSGNNISAKTSFGKINCNNCGRNVEYEVTVPRKTKQKLTNKFGDVKLNNAEESLTVNVEFGKLYANNLMDADVNVQHGGTTINKCVNLNLKSAFSKNKFGEIGMLSGSVAHGGIEVDELTRGDVKSEFSNLSVDRLKQSFTTNGVSHGSLKIGKVDEGFSTIKVKASFSKVDVSFAKSNNFKAVLHTSFGNIKTGNLVFYEKTLEKKDVVVGTVGNIKEPSAVVEISNEHGNIVMQ